MTIVMVLVNYKNSASDMLALVAAHLFHRCGCFQPGRKKMLEIRSRAIMYTISLTNPLAPKTATVTETQVRCSYGFSSCCFFCVCVCFNINIFNATL